MNKDQYRRIESLFSELIESVSDVFSEPEKNEVQEYIDVSEYGLALETFAGVVDEENKKISERSDSLVEALATEMNMDLAARIAELKEAMKK